MDITFEQIKKANESIVTTDIKGKEYAEVNQRIKAFRMIYPTGFITTELASNENGVCIIKASVGFYDDNGEAFILGTGLAYEKENSTFINKTSYIENCETSAVGRALGMAGFGIDTSVASYEEVATAIANQESTTKPKTETKTKAKEEPKSESQPQPTNKPIDAKTIKALKAKIKDDGIDENKLLALYNVTDCKELTEIQYYNMDTNWEKVKEKFGN